MKILAKLKSSQRGQALVEFALVLPMLLLLVLGVLEFGWILKAEIAVSAAAREGARYAAAGKTEAQAESDAMAHVPGTSVNVTINETSVIATAESTVNSLIGFHVDSSSPLGFYLSTADPIDASASVTMRLE
ncbi:TadE/TadG family type IV pilus assembly protein [Trichococcus ilyis]|uniref:TadE-like protein n=1 Tax=Trichococcus ilyis TaxID=640938 RepID=A0A143ZB37_9LACT|nr:TadE family type IV pilus minor pilin [Trichococcus ilyis]CZR10361.1 Hypothetical protein TR210_2914 [Trichococcus ilyis]SEJ95194.1 TadE-like protein [Trichococcus ilyis]